MPCLGHSGHEAELPHVQEDRVDLHEECDRGEAKQLAGVRAQPQAQDGARVVQEQLADVLLTPPPVEEELHKRPADAIPFIFRLQYRLRDTVFLWHRALRQELQIIVNQT